jgi:hypothetical protein
VGRNTGVSNAPIATRKALKWQRAGEALRARLGPGLSQRVISVCDREADILDYLTWQHRVAGRYVIRATADRALGGHAQRLWATLEAAPVIGENAVEIAQRGGRQARRARVSIRVQTVRLGAASPLTCTALLVREDAAPDGVEPLEWLLLTTEPVTHLEEALDIVWIYTRRWRIEEFHKAWKSGVGVETLRGQSRTGRGDPGVYGGPVITTARRGITLPGTPLSPEHPHAGTRLRPGTE